MKNTYKTRIEWHDYKGGSTLLKAVDYAAYCLEMAGIRNAMLGSAKKLIFRNKWKISMIVNTDKHWDNYDVYISINDGVYNLEEIV